MAQNTPLTPSENNLYNTGYFGNFPDVPGEVDTHYFLGNLNNQPTYRANQLANNWYPSSPNSSWITLSPLSTAGGNAQTYDYHLNLTNIPAGRMVTISGNIAVDDSVSISAHGEKPPFFQNSSTLVVPATYSTFYPFTTIKFISGTVNYIDFYVYNVNGPTGLNVALSGYYGPLPVGMPVQFVPVNLTPNQAQVLQVINAINANGTPNACFGDLTASLIALSQAAFGPNLEQLTPVSLSVLSDIAFNNASFETQDLDDYLAHRRDSHGDFQRFGPGLDFSGLVLNDSSIDPALWNTYGRLSAWNPPTPNRNISNRIMLPKPEEIGHWNTFVRGNVTLGQNFSGATIQHTDYTDSTFELGTDYQFNSHWLAGLTFSYSHTDTSLDSFGGSATIDSYSPGIYGSFSQEGWYANALASYSRNNYTETRNIRMGAGDFSQSPSGAPCGDEEILNLDGGKDFHSHGWTYGPTLGLQYVHLNIDPFTESGGCSADLSVGNQAADSLRGRLGGHVSYTTRTAYLQLTPFLDASWQHELLDGPRTISSAFTSIAPDTFTIQTPNTSRDSALISTGLNIDITKSATAFLAYQMQAGQSDFFGQSVVLGAKLSY